MYNSKKIIVTFKKSGFDNPTDSLTTYSLMAVLAGGFFVQIFLSTDQNPVLSCIDKIILLATSGISSILILLSVEIMIDIFHFTFNNKNEEDIKSKYKRQLLSYNIGVLFLVFTFVYAFFDFLIYHLCRCFHLEPCLNPCLNCYILIILLLTIFPLVARKWIKDIRFLLFKAEIVVETAKENCRCVDNEGSNENHKSE